MRHLSLLASVSRGLLLLVVLVSLVFPVLAESQVLVPAVTFRTLADTEPMSEQWPGDFNGDGIADLVVRGSQFLEIRLGNGDGTFRAGVVSNIRAIPLATGDVNRDGRVDVLAAGAVLPGNGDGTLGTPRAVNTGDASFALLTDFDNDGRLDLVSGTPGLDYVTLSFLRGNGDFTFEPSTGIPLTSRREWERSAGIAVDLNGDGLRDIAVAHTFGVTTVLLNQGQFSFSRTDVPGGHGTSTDVTARDVNGDGKVDLLTSGRLSDTNERPWTDGYAVVALGNGDGTFAPAVEYATRPGANSIVVGDFTHDGILDIATSNHSYAVSENTLCYYILYQNANSLSILPGRGDGTFDPATSFALARQAANPPIFPGRLGALNTADVNGDRFPDLLVGDGTILITGPPRVNRPPLAFAGNDYRVTWGSPEMRLNGTGSDPDGHFLDFQWSGGSGGSFFHADQPTACHEASVHGTHRFSLTVSDGHGGTASDDVVVEWPTPTPPVVTIASPTAGEHLTEGVPYTIRWTATDLDGLASASVLFITPQERAYSVGECSYLPGTATECTWNSPGPATGGRIEVIVQDITGAEGTAAINITIDARALPTGWQNSDVGAVGTRGSASFSGGSFTVHASGADTWGSADEFHWAYKTLSGDFDVVARVASVENVHQWTKAGLMIRETLAAGARHASLFATPTTIKGVAFQRRTTTNGASVHTAGPLMAPPVWLRLLRVRDEVSAYYRVGSSGSWTFVGRQVLTGLARVVHAGLAVSSHVDGRLATATFDSVAINEFDPFSITDVGAVGMRGTWSLGEDGLYIEGSGADIWGTADAFRYYNRAWTGDGTITVRVNSIENTHAWAKAGVMFRETLAPGSKHVMAIVSPGRGLAVQYRAATGSTSANAGLAPGTAPEWLRLTRAGNTFTALASEDGRTWRTLGTTTVAMGAQILVGVAVTSHNNATLASAWFDGRPIVD